MTAPVTLGSTPVPVTVLLATDSDFVCELVAETDWPDGAGIELRFLTAPGEDPIAVWQATVTGSAAHWDVVAEDVQEVLDAEAFVVRMHYVEPDGTVLLWGRGRARAI